LKIEEGDGSASDEGGDGSSSWGNVWYPGFGTPNVASSPTTMELDSETRFERKKTKISRTTQKSPLLAIHKNADGIGMKNQGKKRGA
jgi:hypothetical protein